MRIWPRFLLVLQLLFGRKDVDVEETVEEIEAQNKAFKRVTTAVPFFLVGATLGAVLAKVLKKSGPKQPPTPASK